MKHEMLKFKMQCNKYIFFYFLLGNAKRCLCCNVTEFLDRIYNGEVYNINVIVIRKTDETKQL